jgi:integrase
MARELITGAEIKRRTSALLKGTAVETTLFDGDGLVLRLRKASGRKGSEVRGVWQYWTQTGGRRTKIGLGSYPATPVDEARTKADSYRALAAAGIAPSSALPEQAGRPLVPKTLDDLMERFEEDYLARHRKDKGADAMAAYRLHIAPAIGSTALASIRKLHINHAIAPVVARGHIVRAKQLLALLRQGFNWAVRNDLVATDPTAGLRKSDLGGDAGPRDRVLSGVEIQELATRLREFRLAGPAGRERRIPVLGLATQGAIWLMLSTLMRVGEVSAAQWSWVDEEAATLSIPSEVAKNGQRHTVHLSPFAIRILACLRVLAAGSTFLIPDKTGRAGVGEKTITKLLIDRQRPEGGLKGRTSQASALVLPGGRWSSHDLRRTGATIMREAGVDPAVIERCLNHVDGETRLQKTYQVVKLHDQRRAAFDRLGTVLDNLVPPSMTQHLDPRAAR